ncbi:hypothetical protein A7D00_5174 [Trichophyton violaceum]|uniref:RCHY1 zinc-ribbon domain-containing protein n=1 Tax=Trichophyton violaceum TaxID=34388 RepID=A0A178FFP2_TRIVO|nr:hypothetical protein A7D00_5174 [Trichophyton violaceum]
MDLGSDSQGQPASNGNETTSQAHLDQLGWEENTTKYAAESDNIVETRRRIHAIWKLDVSSQEKARLMHRIMTEGYYSAVKSRSPPPTPQGHDAPCTPESSRKQRALGNLSSSSELGSGISGSPYYLSQEDLKRTYFCRSVNDNQPADDPFMDNIEEAASDEVVELGCMHYKRNVKIQCFTCKKCRQANGAIPVAPNQPFIIALYVNSGMMMLKKAYTIAVIVESVALVRDLEKIFSTARLALPVYQLRFKKPTDALNAQRNAIVQYAESSCSAHPIRKSVTNMEANFRNLDRTIMSQPMPPELKDTNAFIYCNDCHAKSVVPYHWLGLKCEICESYNTIQRQLLNGSYNPAQPTEGRQNSISGGQGLAVPTHGTSNDHRTGSRNSVFETPGHHFDEAPTDSGASQARSLPHTSFLHSSRAAPKSPVVTNYFALSRQEDVDSSTSQSRGPMRLTRGSFSGFNFWSGVNIKERLGLIGSSDAETDPGSDGSSDNQETEDEDDEDEDEDESPDTIDIFGHR